MKLWRAACCNAKQFHHIGDQLSLETHAILPAQSIRQCDIDNAIVAISVRNAANSMALQEEFEKLGPSARIVSLIQPVNSTDDVRSHPRATASINILRRFPESLRPVVAGIECYAAFCDPLSIPYFPPDAEIIRQRGSVSSRWGLPRYIYRIFGMSARFPILPAIGILPLWGISLTG